MLLACESKRESLVGSHKWGVCARQQPQLQRQEAAGMFTDLPQWAAQIRGCQNGGFTCCPNQAVGDRNFTLSAEGQVTQDPLNV